jgi:hypothetical protein
MMRKDFEGNVSPAKGAVCIELAMGNKMLLTTFFVINGKGAYDLLMGGTGFMQIVVFLHNAPVPCAVG